MCGCVAVFACIHLCMSECLSNFYGDYPVKRKAGRAFWDDPHGAPTYEEGRAEQMFPSSVTTAETRVQADYGRALRARSPTGYHDFSSARVRAKTANYTTPGGGLFCIRPLPVVAKYPF